MIDEAWQVLKVCLALFCSLNQILSTEHFDSHTNHNSYKELAEETSHKALDVFRMIWELEAPPRCMGWVYTPTPQKLAVKAKN